MGEDLDSAVAAVTKAVSSRLGDGDPKLVKLVVREVIATLSGEATAGQPSLVDTPLGSTIPFPSNGQPTLASCIDCVEQQRRDGRPRAVVTASGANRRGVVAAIASCIAEADGDIENVSQTIIADFFTMIVLVDISALCVSFAQLKQSLHDAAERLGIHVVVMHEEVMHALQRV